MATEEERDNFFSLTLLLFRNGNQRLREYFKTQWLEVYKHVKPGTKPPPWQDTPADVTKMKNIGPTGLRFNFPDEEQKFDSGNTNVWDLSLLTRVLRYSSLGFVVPGSAKSKALVDLKHIRNTLICHAHDAAIPNGVFHTEWKKACDALKLFNATEDDFKAVQEDVKKPLDVLYPMLKQCIRQEKEILDAVDKRYRKLEQGHERILQVLASLLEGQAIQSKIIAVFIVVAGCILYGQYKDNYQAALVIGLNITCLLLVLWYLLNWAFMFAYVRYCSKALKSCIKGYTEYLPKVMASHYVTSARTDDIFTNLTVYYDRKQVKKGQVEDQSRSEQLQEYSQRIGHRVKEYIDIFIDTVRKSPKRILLIGKAGVGKSLLCLKITRDWAFNNFRIDLQFVYLLTFRQLEALRDKKLNFLELLNRSALLDEHSVIGDSLFKYLMSNPSKVLFILDGYDEYSRQHREDISNDNLEQKYFNNPREKMPVSVLCSKLIRGKIFRDSVVLISSRPGEAEELVDLHFDRYVEVAGFSSEQVTEFVEKYFSKPEEEETKKTVREHIEKNENLVSFCHIPLLCLLLCWCLEWRICQSGNTENLPAKITDIYHEVVQVSLEKLHAKLKYAKKLTETVKHLAQETFTKLEQLSGYLLKQKKYIFTEEDMKESKLSQDEIENLKISGILHSLPATRISAFKVKHEYSFTHLTFLEYLAACFFVKNQEVPDTNETSGQTLVFMSGLLSKEKDEQLMKKLMEGIKPGNEYDDVNKLLTLQCLYEYGDDELSKLTISNLHDKYLDSHGRIGFDGITDVDVQCVSYLLNVIHLLLQEHHVQSFSHVSTLYISNSSLTSCSVGVVCKLLVHHSYITRLGLFGCRLDDNSVEVITNSLLNTKITRLDLSFNNITDKGAESILSVLLHDNCCVEWLDLRDNKEITEECKERFRKLVQEKKPHFTLEI